MTAPFARQDIRPCAVCHKPLMTDNPPGLFWRVCAERMMIDRRAVQREAGLEMMMGGNVALAAALSPERTFAQQVAPLRALLICEPCVLTRCGSLPVALIAEE